MNDIELFDQERPRLVQLASRILSDKTEAEDIVQQAWLRLERNDGEIANLGGWLTTVTTRLCLDRLKSRTPVPADNLIEDSPDAALDPAEQLALADTVGIALQVVLERLTPTERVAFVLHDSFGFDFSTIASMLGSSPAATRKLASRARAKIGQPTPQDALADWEVVDAFMSAAREGEFGRLLELLAPDAVVRADAAAALAGTPQQIDGRDEIAAFFNGSAQATLPIFVADRPGSAWFHRGAAKVVFDFTINNGLVERITFRAEPATLAQVARRDGAVRR